MAADLAHSEEYFDFVSDLFRHPLVQSMAGSFSHGKTTVLEHCMAVSWHSYRLSRRLGLDARAAARAGLLHDLYLYDWHLGHDYKGLHGFVHPQIALENARENFAVSPAEADSIACHMWPLTLQPPRHRVGWVVCLVDKICAIREMFGRA